MVLSREIPLQHMKALADKKAGRKTDPPALKPNQVQLYSFYKPGLVAGSYRIEAEQKITSDGPHGEEELRIYNRKRFDPVPIPPPKLDAQKFEVIAPQFNLDPKLVDSYYPPDGHQDEGRVLPHLVLNDPHFPWERKVDKNIDLLWDPDVNKDGKYLNSKVPPEVVDTAEKAVMRNAVPWVLFISHSGTYENC